MIRVRLLTKVGVAGAAIASLPALITGCAADPNQSISEGEQAQTGIEAGSGTLSLYAYSVRYQSTTNGDEFIRVGERLTGKVGLNDVLNLIYVDPTDRPVIEALRADPTKLTLSMTVTYTHFDDSKTEATLPVTLAPGAGGVQTGTTSDFVVPARVKAMSTDYVAEFEKDGKAEKRTLLAPHGVRNSQVVFGGYAPDKLALFDTNGMDRRTRVVEGGGVVAGANLTLSVTDWRLDSVVDKTGLDLRYGRQQSYSRFGAVIVDAVGSLEYVVSAAVSTDDGKTFMPIELAKVADAEVVRGQWGRSAHQKTFAVPPNAGPNVKVALHIQAYLVTPSYGSEVFDAKYGPNQRILLKDVWDNAGGGNYSLPVSQK